MPSATKDNHPSHNETKSQKFAVLEYNDEEHAENPEDLQIGEHGYKYRILDGRVVPPFIGPKRYEMTRRFKTEPTDICFVSWPRSGSTWLSYILVLLTGSDSDKDKLRDSFHWLESGWLYQRTEEEVQNAPRPRIFASHMPYDMALGGVPEQNPCKYIYIARNPKDTCVSCFHFDRQKSWSGYYSGEWDHWLEMFMNGQCHRGDWFDHVLSWWEHRHADNILFLTYEDLKRDPEAEVCKIAAFLGVEMTPERLDSIKGKISFSAMKASGFTDLGEIKELSHGEHFRRGKSGSWKDQFTVAQSEAFDLLFEKKMGSSGLSF
ncbi:P-loop containing nucleoside triphosphate hydrolase protein [Aspergillus pseudonomiae]|nr:P-loop containing nucleoside triphosphate hydrolase protein [Aspergillus pseudonomiae]